MTNESLTRRDFLKGVGSVIATSQITVPEGISLAEQPAQVAKPTSRLEFIRHAYIWARGLSHALRPFGRNPILVSEGEDVNQTLIAKFDQAARQERSRNKPKDEPQPVPPPSEPPPIITDPPINPPEPEPIVVVEGRSLIFSDGRCHACQDLQPREYAKDIRPEAVTIAELTVDNFGKLSAQPKGKLRFWPYLLIAQPYGISAWGDDGNRWSVATSRNYYGLDTNFDLSNPNDIYNQYNLAPLEGYRSLDGSITAVITGNPYSPISVISRQIVTRDRNGNLALRPVEIPQYQMIGFYDTDLVNFPDQIAFSYSGALPSFSDKPDLRSYGRIILNYQKEPAAISRTEIPLPADLKGSFYVGKALGREGSSVFLSAVNLDNNQGVVIRVEPEKDLRAYSVYKLSPQFHSADITAVPIAMARARQSGDLVFYNIMVSDRLVHGWYAEVVPSDKNPNNQHYFLPVFGPISEMGTVIGKNGLDYLITGHFGYNYATRIARP